MNKNKSRSNVQKGTGSEEPRENFNMNFAKERRSLLEINFGSSFLPPINEESKKRILKIPVLRLDNETKKMLSDRDQSN